MNRSSRKAARDLAALLKRSRRELRRTGALAEAMLDDLRVGVAVCERQLLRCGEYAYQPKALRETLDLLLLHDPDSEARALKLAEIDRLTLVCDRIMDCGMIPAPLYLCGLGEALLDFEQNYSCGADAHATSTAWDVLAQVEAGLGEAVAHGHYQQARQRYAATLNSGNVTPFRREGRNKSAAAAGDGRGQAAALNS
jgi:hypothetical protein